MTFKCRAAVGRGCCRVRGHPVRGTPSVLARDQRKQAAAAAPRHCPLLPSTQRWMEDQAGVLHRRAVCVHRRRHASSAATHRSVRAHTTSINALPTRDRPLHSTHPTHRRRRRPHPNRARRHCATRRRRQRQQRCGRKSGSGSSGSGGSCASGGSSGADSWQPQSAATRHHTTAVDAARRRHSRPVVDGCLAVSSQLYSCAAAQCGRRRWHRCVRTVRCDGLVVRPPWARLRPTGRRRRRPSTSTECHAALYYVCIVWVLVRMRQRQ